MLTVVPMAIVSAQTFGGGIGGAITDSSGASVAGAAILIEEVDPGLKWKVNHANFLPPTSSSLQLFTQSVSPIASAGELTATSTPSRQLQFALKIMW